MTMNKSGETKLKHLKHNYKDFLENTKKGKQSSGAEGDGCQSLSDVDLSPQFLLIFHKAAAGELQEESGLMALAKLSEIDVALEGVKGAKNFFEAKVGGFFLCGTIAPSLHPAQQEIPVSDSLINSLRTSLNRSCVIAGE